MLIAISGGIGCGKTVVSRIVTAMGWPVYDCDSRAAMIMNTDTEIKRKITAHIHPQCVRPDGTINRQMLSEIVFSDYDALQMLNSIVHAAVRRDLASWYDQRKSRYAFVETAILYQSGLDRMVDEVWEIEAPLDLRIERVMTRNGFSRDEVLSRIASQDSFVIDTPHTNVKMIVNDSVSALLPQVEEALNM